MTALVLIQKYYNYVKNTNKEAISLFPIRVYLGGGVILIKNVISSI